MKESEHRIKTDAELIDLGIRYDHLDVNRKTFKKSPTEKLELKAAKSNHNAFLRAASFNPKKSINVSPKQLIQS